MKKYNWIKGNDFMDNSPRYSIKGRDPSSTYETISVVIWQEIKSSYCGKENIYIGEVCHREKEYADRTKEHKSIKDCKKEVEQILEEYFIKFPDDIGLESIYK